MTLAGFPTTVAPGGTERVTTAPAATMALLPMVMPGRMVAPAPIEAPASTTVCRKCAGALLLRGKRSFVKVTFGPIKTSSPTRKPSHSCTPLLTVTRSPITTSFSPFEILFCVAGLYLLINLPLSKIASRLERRLAQSD